MSYDKNPVNPEDKRIILAQTDMNQTFPLRYPWAWDNYLEMIDNNWTPREIPVARDVQNWKTNTLTDSERQLFIRVLAQLTTFDIQRGRDISESLMQHIDAPEIKQALIKQAEQEALHTWSYQYIIENLGLDQNEIYNMYRTEKQLLDRVLYAQKFSDAVSEIERKDLESENVKKLLLKGIAFWYLGFEGIWFYMNLAGPIQSLARRGLMTASAEQFQYILRDEDLHVSFGVSLLQEFIKENPECWDDDTKTSISTIITDVVRLEEKFASYILEEPVLGYSVNDHNSMVRYYANTRLLQFGLPPLTAELTPSLKWISEMIELRKEKNFFETRVTEYRTGGSLKFEGFEEENIEDITKWNRK